MHPALVAHVKSDQKNLARPELQREIERLESAVPSATDDALRLHDQIFAISATLAGDFHPAHIRESVQAVASPADLEPMELRQAPAVPPPWGIAPVDQICPRAQVHIFLNRDDLDPSP